MTTSSGGSSGDNNAAGMLAALELVAASLENDEERAKYWCQLGMGTVAKIQDLIERVPSLTHDRDKKMLHEKAADTQIRLRKMLGRWNDSLKT